jgi:hypothetical protein
VQHTSQIYERLDIAPDDATHRRVVAVVRYLSHAPNVSRLVAAAN